MSRLLYCGCHANIFLWLKYGSKFSKTPLFLSQCKYTTRNIIRFNQPQISTTKWLRHIQTETQPQGTNLPPFPPPKGEAAKNISQPSLLHPQGTILEETEKVRTSANEISNPAKKVEVKVTAKPNLWVWIKNETLHYYHGFKLFFYEIKISSKLFGKVLKGNSLTRRERRQLERTVADIFRLVPFTIFLIVPFMEFLLPFAIKIFPGMLPSTFQTVKTKEEKIRAELKVKLVMSKFLRNTMGGMKCCMYAVINVYNFDFSQK